MDRENIRKNCAIFFAAMVWNLDKSVGRVVKSLAKNGLLDNTLIVLMSDNGAQTKGLYANDGSNFPFRGVG
jgi:arylsulfatase A-like enzyme